MNGSFHLNKHTTFTHLQNMKNHLGFFLIAFVTLHANASPTVISTHIHTDQFGYPVDAKKVAVISDPMTGYNGDESFTPGNTYEVREWNTDMVVFSGQPEAWGNGNEHLQSGDRVWWFDFTDVNMVGSYYVYDLSNAVGSGRFEISVCVYEDIMKTAVRTFFYQRCGHAKTPQYAGMQWTDAICHGGTQQDSDCRYYDDLTTATSKDLSGGWHDAGDYNKYVNFAFDPVLDLLDAYAYDPTIWTDDFNITESGNGISDLLDEIKYELDWLLKMQQEDGSVLCMVGAMSYNSASPPSADVTHRVYGPATTASTFSSAAMFARAAKVYNDAGLTSYSTTLQNAAIDAWTWAMAHSNITFYNSGTIVSGEQQTDDYGTFTRQFCAAVYLYELTGEAMYQDFVESNYSETHLMQWGYAYPFEYALQKALTHYSMLNSASSLVAEAIQNAFIASLSENNTDNLPAYLNATDAYRAYLSDNNYTWGSNTTKARQGLMFMDMYNNNWDAAHHNEYREAAEAMLEYFHGINPLGMVYLTNMSEFGAEHSCRSIYHGWFIDGSPTWDEVGVSEYGPAPGFVPGGANPTYALDGCCPSNCGDDINNALCDYPMDMPPLSQPIQKSYRDWNTGWPQNSWTVTEIGIYTQAAYIKLLAPFIEINCSTVNVQETEIATDALEIFPNPASDALHIKLQVSQAGAYTIQILDESGRLVQEYRQTTASHLTRTTVDISNLSHGYYFLQVKSGDQKMVKGFVK